MHYVGGKFRQRRHFAPAILADTKERTEYWEPFVGGGWMLEAMAPHFKRVIAGDVHEDLILMYQALMSGWDPPEAISEDEYRELKLADPSALRGFAGFGASFGGKWFGGYGRHGEHKTTIVEQNRNSLLKLRAALPTDTEFVHRSYEMATPHPGTVIYADPPYAARGVEFKDSNGFDHGRFWWFMDFWTDRGAHVYVSEFSAPDHWEPLVTSVQRLTLSRNSPVTPGEQGLQYDTLYRRRR